MKSFSWREETKKQWDNRAKDWHINAKEMWENGSRKEILPFFIEHIPIGNIVDLGCGDGYGSHLLNKKGYKVVGMDISERMVTIAKNLESNRLTFVQGDLSKTPFEDEQFSGIMAINSLEWTENPLEALNEIKRIVINGGYGCFGILGPTAKPRINSFPRLEGNNAICNTMMPWEFEKLALKNGWQKIAEKGVYKRDITNNHLIGLSNELKQALTFMNLFILKKVN
jgi:SAM-dependent methyltransferase